MAQLVSFVDGVELHVHVEKGRQRRLRFLRDGGARLYARRMRAHLEQRGYFDRRRRDRTIAWLAET
jgi:hypothetical protein